MSTGKRAYSILRGYVHREWERLSKLEWLQAEQELDTPTTPDASRVEIARKVVHIPPEERPAKARSVLGVGAEASFGEIRAAFERLEERCRPERFPENTLERLEAEDIYRNVHWAYQVLTENVDVLEKRFGTLEVD
ncbi:MAG: hypothetical protein ACK4XJ_00180 [Fimbriimonadaceae bacterium]